MGLVVAQSLRACRDGRHDWFLYAWRSEAKAAGVHCGEAKSQKVKSKKRRDNPSRERQAGRCNLGAGTCGTATASLGSQFPPQDSSDISGADDSGTGGKADCAGLVPNRPCRHFFGSRQAVRAFTAIQYLMPPAKWSCPIQRDEGSLLMMEYTIGAA